MKCRLEAKGKLLVTFRFFVYETQMTPVAWKNIVWSLRNPRWDALDSLFPPIMVNKLLVVDYGRWDALDRCPGRVYAEALYGLASAGSK
jgi:hypothetical protein